eukprot:6335462-Amphidinium_carterae.1
MRRAGKPQRRQLWTELLYKQIREGIELPEGITIEPPVRWVPGMGAADVALAEHELKAPEGSDEPQEEHVEGTTKRRKKRTSTRTSSNGSWTTTT